MTTTLIDRSEIETYGLPPTYAPHIAAILKTMGTSKCAVFDKPKTYAELNRVRASISSALRVRKVKLVTRTNGTKWFGWGEPA